MNNTKLLAVLVLLALVVLASGCTAPAGVSTTIKSPQEASKAVTNISTELDKVSSTLDSIDKTLG